MSLIRRRLQIDSFSLDLRSARMWSRLIPLFLVIAGAAAAPASKTWALLIAGSNGYVNYRHQADICHAYQILHSNGIPDENIVVMMYDDIANNKENPEKGVIINQPEGPNVYEGVLKDYTGDEVNPENFLNVLLGNKEAMSGKGSGKVIESGPNDVVFVNFVDHGAPGLLGFPNTDLKADRFYQAIKEMSQKSRFGKLILYIEACYSGSMFEGLFKDIKNVYVMTAADPYESSYACYYDQDKNALLGDVFSIRWMDDAENGDDADETLHQQYERVRTATNMSHVEEYGDLDIGGMKVRDVIGSRRRDQNIGYKPHRLPHRPMDMVDNIDAPLHLLKKQLLHSHDQHKKQLLKAALADFIKKRLFVDDVLLTILKKLAKRSIHRLELLRAGRHALSWGIFECYKELYDTFNQACMNVTDSPYTRVHLQKLVNMCSVPWLNSTETAETISSVCEEKIDRAEQLHIL